MSIRPIKRVLQAQPTIEGAGVRLRRAFGFGDTKEFDPFLLFDDFRNENPEDYLAGFPWHPHRGIETITYVLAGTVNHGDSLGNKGAMGAGDVQWMTAGSGILHQEMPRGDPQGRMHGFQLWANLPSSLKMTRPRYQDISGGDIPEVTDDDGTRVRVICGSFWGKAGPVEGVAADPRYLDVWVPPGKRKSLPVETSGHAFAYVFEGGGTFRDASEPGAVQTERVGPVVTGAGGGDGPGRRRRYPVPARVGEADRGAGGVVRPHRHEHAGRAAARVRRAPGRHFHQATLAGNPSIPGATTMSPVPHETMNDLPENVRSQVSDLLNNRLAEAIDLQTQAKQAHWNVKGPQFIALHKLFDEINEAVVEYVDLLAERVVQLGGTADGTARVVAERSELPEYPLTISTGEEHVWALSSALSNFGERIRRAIDQTADLGDVDSSDICTEISRGTDKWLWFVESHAEGAVRAHLKG